MKSLVKELFKLFGYTVSRRRPRPRSGEEPSLTDALHEQKRFLRTRASGIIFDVGAHVGETVIQYRKIFPNMSLYAFEPTPATFSQLEKRVGSMHRVKVFNLAFGKEAGQLTININKSSATNSLLQTDGRASETWNLSDVTDTVGSANVSVETIDAFLSAHPEIDSIDLLKLDAQGSEYSIIQGASSSIEMKKIRMIYTEIIIMPTYVGQRSLDEILLLLRGMGYELHNFFNPCYTNDGRLNQVDALFVRADLCKIN